MAQTVLIRPAEFDDLPSAAVHYLGMRQELAWADAALAPGWQERFVKVHLSGMAAGDLRYFVAQFEDRLVGSAVAIVRRSLSEGFLGRRRSGYLANVFVDKGYRRRGIARSLTLAAIEWLRSMGCDRVGLAASEYGRPLYESLGFVAGDEMELRLEPAREHR